MKLRDRLHMLRLTWKLTGASEDKVRRVNELLYGCVPDDILRGWQERAAQELNGRAAVGDTSEPTSERPQH